jgi:hypothetical protein
MGDYKSAREAAEGPAILDVDEVIRQSEEIDFAENRG